MSLLESILGGGQQQQATDFVDRYNRGAPWDGISDDEALSGYQQVAGKVSPEVYQESAEEALGRLTPQQRTQLGQYLRQQSRSQGIQSDFDQDGIDDRFQDPRSMAQMTSRMEQQQPGILGQLLGGAGGSGGGVGSLLSNPIAKAALGGIAAMAVQKMMAGRR
jgi:hypothetical protein